MSYLNMFPGNSAISGAESVSMVYSLFMVSPELNKTNTQGKKRRLFTEIGAEASPLKCSSHCASF